MSLNDEQAAVVSHDEALDRETWEAVTVEPEPDQFISKDQPFNEKKMEQFIANCFGKLIEDAKRPLVEQFQEYNTIVSSLQEQILSLKSAVEGLQTNISVSSTATIPDNEFDDATVSYDLDALLQLIANHKASDLHIRADNCPMVRLEGELLPIGKNILSPADTKKLITNAMTKTQLAQLNEEGSVNFAKNIPGYRFRINAYKQRGTIGAAVRLLRMDIPTIEELNLPLVLKRFAEFNHGLVLVTGPAGSGKSTTLASLMGHINNTKKHHMITIEDPIEFIHKDNLSIVTQREVGTDTGSFFGALKEALRQDPNVILIGEMRDPETVWTATMAAETGHLVFSSLHTHNTTQAIDRMIDMFSGERQQQFRYLLASVLRGIVSLRLIPRADGHGRVPAVEVMVVTPTITSLIMEGQSSEIYPYIVQGKHEGMQTFTESLTLLYENGLITKEDALFHADHPTEFRLGIEGHASGTSFFSINSFPGSQL